ncbi:MAG: hypothetical protein ACRDR6_16940 [Pseudonocardiaceae bacterium]
MGRHATAREPLHVLYVGNSADLGALRRLMEAHGAITRSRLTPEVTVVIADSSVPAGHPAVRDAGTLDIPVMEPAEAIVQFAQWRSHPETETQWRSHPETQWRSDTEVGSPTQLGTVPANRAPDARVKPIRPATAGRRSWLFRRSAR